MGIRDLVGDFYPGIVRTIAGSVRPALALACLILAVFAAPAAAAPLDDLLFDLQVVPLDGRPAPPFTLAGLDGHPVSLAEFKDRVVLLYFWATW